MLVLAVTAITIFEVVGKRGSILTKGSSVNPILLIEANGTYARYQVLEENPVHQNVEDVVITLVENRRLTPEAGDILIAASKLPGDDQLIIKNKGSELRFYEFMTVGDVKLQKKADEERAAWLKSRETDKTSEEESHKS